MSGRNTSRLVANGIPANKRPRVGDSPQLQNRLAVGKLPDDLDPFDDCFTGDELLELEIVASQAESKQSCVSAPKNEHELSNHFKVPFPTKISSTHSTSSLKLKETDELIANLQKRCSEFEKEVNELHAEIEGKSGETRLLRDKVNDVEKTLHEKRQAKHLAELARKDDKAKREISLEKKLEQYKDQLEFKQAELQEAQNLIRNLELKNKDLLQETSAASSRVNNLPSTQGWGESPSQKKVRFIKPESPKVASKIKQQPASVPERNVHTKAKSSSLSKRRRAALTSSRQDRSSGLWSYNDTMLMQKLNSYFQQNARASLQYADGADAISRLLWSNNNDVTDEARVLCSVIMTSLVHALKSPSHQHQGGPAKEQLSPTSWVTSCLQGCVVILSSVPSLSDEFLVDDVISTLLRCAESTDDVTASTSLSILTLLSKDCPSEKISIFHPAIVMVRSILHHATPNQYDVINFLCNFLPHDDIIETIVAQTIDEEPSILSTICRLCISEVESATGKSRFVSKVLQFITALLCHYDVMLSKAGSFADVNHLVNMVLSSLSRNKNNSDRNTMMQQWLYPLHACFNLHYPIPGVSRDPHHVLLLWRLRASLPPHSDVLWVEELKRNLDHETEAMDDF